jgi:hypothetical protein
MMSICGGCGGGGLVVAVLVVSSFSRVMVSPLLSRGRVDVGVVLPSRLRVTAVPSVLFLVAIHSSAPVARATTTALAAQKRQPRCQPGIDFIARQVQYRRRSDTAAEGTCKMPQSAAAFDSV